MLINDQLVFSKAKTGRFPIEGEVEAIFEAIRDGKEPPATPDEPRSAGFAKRIFDKLRN